MLSIRKGQQQQIIITIDYNDSFKTKISKMEVNDFGIKHFRCLFTLATMAHYQMEFVKKVSRRILENVSTHLIRMMQIYIGKKFETNI